MYPDCMYSKTQLKAMLAVLNDWMNEHGYTVPKACQQVLVGKFPGGTDAIPGNRSEMDHK